MGVIRIFGAQETSWARFSSYLQGKKKKTTTAKQRRVGKKKELRVRLEVLRYSPANINDLPIKATPEVAMVSIELVNEELR